LKRYIVVVCFTLLLGKLLSVAVGFEKVFKKSCDFLVLRGSFGSIFYPFRRKTWIFGCC